MNYRTGGEGVKPGKNKMKISSRLSLSYALLVTVFVIVAVFIFYRYYYAQIYDEGKENLVQISDTVMAQVDSHLNTLDQVTIDVMTGSSFSTTWNHWLTDGRTYADTATLRRRLVDAYKNRSNIRRVAIYNLDGEYICTGAAEPEQEAVRERAQNLINNYNMNQATSRVYLGQTEDFWDDSRGVTVVTEIKPIKNADTVITGFIEVQQNVFYMDEVCAATINGSEVGVAVLMDDTDEYFYSNMGRDGEYMERLAQISNQYSRIRQTKDEMIAIAPSNYFSCRTIVVVQKSVLNAAVNQVLKGIILVAFIMIVLNAVFCRIITRVIMKPLNSLVRHMENIDIHNFGEKVLIRAKSPETDILVNSFERMAKRLQEALERQKKMELVQNKALFDALQSVMGPHFLYNSLGGIANMCEQGENEEAADACYSLTEILRYAADYEVTEVTIGDEMDNLKSYLSIMKSRYRQRLEYEIHMDDECKYLLIPKLTYQPLAENAIKFSLIERETVVIKISTTCANGKVTVEVADNGCGISEEAAEKIRKRLKEFSEEEVALYTSAKVQFGGMGLGGTLIRLSLFYGDSFWYELNPENKEGGTSILFGFDR